MEGVAANGKLHPVQQAFIEHGALAVWLLHPRLYHVGEGSARAKSQSHCCRRFVSRSPATSADAPAMTRSCARYGSVAGKVTKKEHLSRIVIRKEYVTLEREVTRPQFQLRRLCCLEFQES